MHTDATGAFEARPQVAAAEEESSRPGKRFKRRHVYHLPGYDTAGCEAQYRRFAGQLVRFKRTWPVEASLSVSPSQAWGRRGTGPLPLG